MDEKQLKNSSNDKTQPLKSKPKQSNSSLNSSNDKTQPLKPTLKQSNLSLNSSKNINSDTKTQANRKIRVAGTSRNLTQTQANKKVKKVRPKTQKIQLVESQLINPDTGESQMLKKEDKFDIDDLIYSEEEEKKAQQDKKIKALDSIILKDSTKTKQKKIKKEKSDTLFSFTIVVYNVYILFLPEEYKYKQLVSRTNTNVNNTTAKPLKLENKTDSKAVNLTKKVPISENNWGIEFSKKYVSEPIAIPGLLANDFTLEFWINIQEEINSIVPLLTFKGKKLILSELFITSKKYLGFYSYTNEGEFNQNMFIFSRKSLAVSPIESYHIAITKKDTNAKLYINGQNVLKHSFIGSKTLPIESISILDRMEKGYETGIVLDEIRVSNKEIYSSSFTPSRRLDYQKDTTVFYAPCEYIENKNDKFIYWVDGIEKSKNLKGISWINVQLIVSEINKILAAKLETKE